MPGQHIFLMASDSEAIMVTPVNALTVLKHHIMSFFVSGFCMIQNFDTRDRCDPLP